MSQLRNVKISTPTYKEEVPSSKQKIEIEPFRVGDEKALMIAAESKDGVQMMNALKKVVGNCTTANPEELETYDLEYLFLKLRSVSVGEVATIGLPCGECEATNKIDLDISKVKVQFDETHSTTVKISDQLGFEMKAPDLELVSGLDGENVDDMLKVVAHSIKTVYYGDETISVGEDEWDDLLGILNQLTTDQFSKVQQYFSTQPKLKQDVTFTCGQCEHDNKTTLEGLASFF